MAKTSCARCGQNIIDQDVAHANHLRDDTHRQRKFSGRGEMAVMKAASGYIPEAASLRYTWGPSYSPPDLHMQCGCCCAKPYPVEPEVAAMVSGFMRSAGFATRVGQEDSSADSPPADSPPQDSPPGDSPPADSPPPEYSNPPSGGGGGGFSLPSIPGLPTDPSMIPSDPAQIQSLAQSLLGSGFPTGIVISAVQLLVQQAQSGGDPSQIANAQALLSSLQGGGSGGSGGGSGSYTPPPSRGGGVPPTREAVPMTLANRPYINTSIFQFAPGVVPTKKTTAPAKTPAKQAAPVAATPSRTPVIIGAIGSGAALLLGATALWAVVPIALGVAYMELSKPKASPAPSPKKA